MAEESEEGMCVQMMCGTTVEAIEQQIAAPASSHFDVLECFKLSAVLHPLCAHSRVCSCSPRSLLAGMGKGGGFKDGVKTFGCFMLLWLRRTAGA
jgi:hypothetical protein